MIEIVRTNNNTGLSITGDTLDLNQLKEFLYKFSNEDDLYTLFIAREARKASSGQRLKHSVLGYDHNKEIEYYSFNIVLPDWIFFLDELLNNMLKQPSNQLDHSILSLLKYYTEQELIGIDPHYGQIIFDRLGHLRIVKILQETIIIDFLDSRVGKKRLINLFENLQKYSEFSFSEDKKKLMSVYALEAAKLECSVEELTLSNSLHQLYDKVKW